MYMPLGTAFETLLALYYNSFILKVELLVLVSTALRWARDIKYLILMLEMCMVTVIVKGRVLLEIPSVHKLIQYFQSLYMNEDIYEFKGVHIVNLEFDLFSSSIEYCSISNVNSYQCSCKQCCAIAVYSMCYFVINPCGYWTSGTLSALLSNRNTPLYNVVGEKRL